MDITSKQQDILEAIIDMLGEKKPKLTTKTIAKKIVATESAIYKHFSGKHHIYQTLLQVIESALITEVDSIFDKGDNFIEIFNDTARSYLQFMAKNKGVSRILAGGFLDYEDPKLSGEVYVVIKKFEYKIRDILIDMKSQTEITTSQEPGIIANMTVNYLQGLGVRFIYSSFRESPMAIFDKQWKTFSSEFFINKI